MIGTLRSSLAKNAMICLTEMFRVLKDLMNKSLDMIITKIMRKGMEKNNFLLTEVQNVLISMCSYASEGKILPFLFNLCHNKNIEIKLLIILCF